MSSSLHEQIAHVVHRQPVVDMHTHLYPPSFGTPKAGSAGASDPKGLMLWGLDELLTYHYLVAELFRVVDPARVTPEQFFAMDKSAQAELIWHELFIERSPISEACRGVLTTLEKLGLDVAARDLAGYRRWFAEQNPDSYIDRVMELSGVTKITMTNDVFDDNERSRWLADATLGDDERFDAVLRFDPLLCDWLGAAAKLAGWGYDVCEQVNEKTVAHVRRFLGDWIERMNPVYAAVSLPPEFRYTEQGDWATGSAILRQAVLPELGERGLAFAMMIGARRAVNPRLQLAGDMGGAADVDSVCAICRDFPGNRFLVTMLAHQNQHELAVAARKFGNLMLFGCWWFLNNPSIIEQMTRFRTELLGLSYVPQHSDARVLDQLIYKWSHSRQIIAKVLIDKYADLAATGWTIDPTELQRDAALLLADNYRRFIARP